MKKLYVALDKNLSVVKKNTICFWKRFEKCVLEKKINFYHTWGIGKNGASLKVRQNRIIIDHGSLATNSLIAFSIGVFSCKRLISGLI